MNNVHNHAFFGYGFNSKTLDLKQLYVVFTVDSCTRAFVAAVKQVNALEGFRTRLPNLHTPRTDVCGGLWKETEAIRLLRSQCTTRMILKPIISR